MLSWEEFEEKEKGIQPVKAQIQVKKAEQAPQNQEVEQPKVALETGSLSDRLERAKKAVADFDKQTGEEALEQLAEFAFDVLLTDLRLPGIDGSAVLTAALDLYPNIVGIVMTGFGTVKDAVDAIKQGASEFITKPFQLDQLLHVVESALEQYRLRSENAYLRSQLEERYRFAGLVGRSQLMRELFDLLETVAASPSTVLVVGVCHEFFLAV